MNSILPNLIEKELDAALEKELKEAQLRISRRPIGREADLTDPSVVATYIRIRNDRDELYVSLPNVVSDSEVTGCCLDIPRVLLPTRSVSLPPDPVDGLKCCPKSLMYAFSKEFSHS